MLVIRGRLARWRAIARETFGLEPRSTLALARVRAPWRVRLRAWWRTRRSDLERRFICRNGHVIEPPFVTWCEKCDSAPAYAPPPAPEPARRCSRCNARGSITIEAPDLGVQLCGKCAGMPASRGCEVPDCTESIAVRARTRPSGTVIYTCFECYMHYREFLTAIDVFDTTGLDWTLTRSRLPPPTSIPGPGVKMRG